MYIRKYQASFHTYDRHWLPISITNFYSLLPILAQVSIGTAITGASLALLSSPLQHLIQVISISYLAYFLALCWNCLDPPWKRGPDTKGVPQFRLRGATEGTTSGLWCEEKTPSSLVPSTSTVTLDTIDKFAQKREKTPTTWGLLRETRKS